MTVSELNMICSDLNLHIFNAERDYEVHYGEECEYNCVYDLPAHIKNAEVESISAEEAGKLRIIIAR